MLAKISVFLVLSQIVAIAYGGVLPSSSDNENCTEMYVGCKTQDECCGFMRCLDFGDRQFCGFGTDNPLPERPGEAIQPPVDLIKNLGCNLYGDSCEDILDCCAPYVCTAEKICKRRPRSIWIGYPGLSGFPGK